MVLGLFKLLMDECCTDGLLFTVTECTVFIFRCCLPPSTQCPHNLPFWKGLRNTQKESQCHKIQMFQTKLFKNWEDGLRRFTGCWLFMLFVCNSNAKCLLPCQNKNDIYIFTGFRFTKFELDRYLSLFIQSSNYSNLSRGSQRRRLFLEIFLKRKFYVLFIVCKETSTGYKWLKHKKWRNVCHWNCFFSSKREENISFYKVCIFFDLFAQLFHENCSL